MSTNFDDIEKMLVQLEIIGPDFVSILKEFYSQEEIEIYLYIKLLKSPISKVQKEYHKYSNADIIKIVNNIDIFITNEYGEDYFGKYVDLDENTIENTFSSSIPLRKEK